MKVAPKLLTVFLTLILITGLLFSPVGQATHTSASKGQDKERVLEMTTHLRGPLELVDIRLAERSLKDKNVVTLRRRIVEQSRLAFDSHERWWKEISFEFRNVSGKAIAAIRPELVLTFADRELPFILPVNAYLNDGQRLRPGKETLQPGATVKLELDEDGYNRVMDLLKSDGSSGIVTEASFDVGFVEYADGTGWSKGSTLRRDRNNPQRWRGVQRKTAASRPSVTIGMPVSFFVAAKPSTQGACYSTSNYFERYCAGSNQTCWVRSGLGGDTGCYDLRVSQALCGTDLPGITCTGSEQVQQYRFNANCDCGIDI
jgi:hypothetical protein